MDYQEIYTADYFDGKTSYFYRKGYAKVPKIYFNTLYSSIKKYLPLLLGNKVLDVGCAYGTLLQRFPSSYRKYGSHP